MSELPGIEEYMHRMFGETGAEPEKVKAALNRAHEIRKFEIELAWKRTIYISTFQGLLFTALGASFNAQYGVLVDIFRVIVSVAGIVTSVAWILINIGSKFWYENWEHHVDFLEDAVEGRLHKTVLHGENKTSYSVSRVNTELSKFFMGVWILLTVVFVGRLLLYCLPLSLPCCTNTHPPLVVATTDTSCVALVCILIVAVGILIGLFLHQKWKKCNFKTGFSNEIPAKKIAMVRRIIAGRITPSQMDPKEQNKTAS